MSEGPHRCPKSPSHLSAHLPVNCAVAGRGGLGRVETAPRVFRDAPEDPETLPRRWRMACVVTSLLAVAALAVPAGAANVTTLSLPDATGDTHPSGVAAPQADITMSTAAFRATEIAFTAVTASPLDPRTSSNWAQPATKLSWLIRTTSAAPAYDYELRYTVNKGALAANVFSASDATNLLCAATKVDYSGKAYRASIDPACIHSPRDMTFAATIGELRGWTSIGEVPGPSAASFNVKESCPQVSAPPLVGSPDRGVHQHKAVVG